MNQWYESYINIPYKLFGTDPITGMDCFNLVRYVYEQELKISIPYITSDFLKIVDDKWFEKIHDQLILKAAKNGDWVDITDHTCYDLILMSLGSTNVVNHVAMYVGDNKILQMIENRPSNVTKYHRYFQQYTVKKVRWKTLAN